MADELILVALDPIASERIPGLQPPPGLLTELIMEAVEKADTWSEVDTDG